MYMYLRPIAREPDHAQCIVVLNFIYTYCMRICMIRHACMHACTRVSSCMLHPTPRPRPIARREAAAPSHLRWPHDAAGRAGAAAALGRGRRPDSEHPLHDRGRHAPGMGRVLPELRPPHTWANLDQLVQEGLLFTRAYCQQAICGPSRNSFMSGRRCATFPVPAAAYQPPPATRGAPALAGATPPHHLCASLSRAAAQPRDDAGLELQAVLPVFHPPPPTAPAAEPPGSPCRSISKTPATSQRVAARPTTRDCWRTSTRRCHGRSRPSGRRGPSATCRRYTPRATAARPTRSAASSPTTRSAAASASPTPVGPPAQTSHPQPSERVVVGLTQHAPSQRVGGGFCKVDSESTPPPRIVLICGGTLLEPRLLGRLRSASTLHAACSFDYILANHTMRTIRLARLGPAPTDRYHRTSHCPT
eukprot:SAG22_NODE_3468_length_1693_cov_1.085947_1_plen_418_part_10